MYIFLVQNKEIFPPVQSNLQSINGINIDW